MPSPQLLLEDSSSIPSPSIIISHEKEHLLIKRMMDRPSHDLETAARLSQTTRIMVAGASGGRARARTQETHVMDDYDNNSGETRSSDDSEQEDAKKQQELQQQQQQQQRSLFSRLMLHRPRHALVQRIMDSSDEGECDSLLEQPHHQQQQEHQQQHEKLMQEASPSRKPCSFGSQTHSPAAARRAAFGGGGGGGDCKVRDGDENDACGTSHSLTGMMEISLPLPQRRRPPSNFSNLDSQATHRPSPASFTAVGSVGGAFTRIHPTVEGVPRQVTAVNGQDLKIQWATMMPQLVEPKEQGNGDSGNNNVPTTTIHHHGAASTFHNANNNKNHSSIPSLSSFSSSSSSPVLEGGSFVVSLPNMSAIAAASVAWQHHNSHNNNNNNNNNNNQCYYFKSSNNKKAASSVRTGTDTSGSSSLTTDEISLLSYTSSFPFPTPPNGITDRSLRSSGRASSSSADLAATTSWCCYRTSRFLQNRIPSWFRRAPFPVQMLIVMALVMLLLVLAFLVLSLYMDKTGSNNGNQSNSDSILTQNMEDSSTTNTITDDNLIQETMSQWPETNNNLQADDGGSQRLLFLRHSRKLLH